MENEKLSTDFNFSLSILIVLIRWIELRIFFIS
jgi:hypothetical protein